MQALDHASRLITVLFAVAWLLVKLPLPCLLAALLGLARLSGVEKLQQAVLRLALVLQYVERGELGHWQRLLTDEVDNFPVSLTISVRKISYQEFCLAGLALALTIGIWLK